MATQLADAVVRVNDEVWAIVPNSLTFTEGQGEQEIKAASVGGGAVEQVYVHDIESNFSMVKFELYSTVDSIEDTKTAKDRRNNNVVQIEGRTDEGTITRTFTKAAILNDTEKGLGKDATIPVEFKANPAI
jgi:hypothetical protein